MGAERDCDPMSFQISTFNSVKGKAQVYVKDNIICNDKEKPIQRIIYLHDFANYHKSFEQISKFLAQQDPGKYLHTKMDWKGHGLSTGVRSHISHFDEYVLDLQFLLEKKKQENEKFGFSKNIVIASGMGATVLFQYLLSSRSKDFIDRFVVINPLFGLSDKYFSKIGLGLGRAKIGLPFLRFNHQVKGNILTRDKRVAELWESDPLIHKFSTIRLLQELNTAGQKVRRESYYIETPGLYLLSKNDFLTKRKWVDTFLLGIDENFKEVKVYNRGQHDLLNDIIKEEVYSDILTWLKEGNV